MIFKFDTSSDNRRFLDIEILAKTYRYKDDEAE